MVLPHLRRPVGVDGISRLSFSPADRNGTSAGPPEGSQEQWLPLRSQQLGGASWPCSIRRTSSILPLSGPASGQLKPHDLRTPHAVCDLRANPGALPDLRQANLLKG